MTEHKYKPGDMVRLVGDEYPCAGLCLGDIHPVARVSVSGNVYILGDNGYEYYFYVGEVEPASTAPKTWGKMTPEEKGALLLAEHEGKVIEYQHAYSNGWQDMSQANPTGWHSATAYRVKPERKTAALCWRVDGPTVKNRIGTIELVNGEPDCSTVKMEKL